MRILIGIPLFNEEKHLYHTFNELTLERYELATEVTFLIFDDGSTDRSPEIVRMLQKNNLNLKYLRHEVQMGYGETVTDILKYGINHEKDYDIIITFDADMQHDTATINLMIDIFTTSGAIDIVSSSRYLCKAFLENITKNVPYDRFLINMLITRLLNEIYGFNLTDSFCGLKGYRVKPLMHLIPKIRRFDYAFPLEFFLKGKKQGMTFEEVRTPLIYLEHRRPREDWITRLKMYLSSIEESSWNDGQVEELKEWNKAIHTFIETRLSKISEYKNVECYKDFWNKFPDLDL